ncbi:TRAP transporter small permease subunit [Catenovulum sp. SM1970]|uniref:TRAP transporter small permease subunit n=1 Tax=Marinifaba aquimaris TaxID=2741323 RepID=UPI00157484E9|nr:TRAP transporter small permease subunit [Marinifaba aquimaris]NTS77598.1 TRAP transporter small permease subunit [Marinifaba aquimaris]
MIALLENISCRIDGFSELLGRTMAWLTLLMVLMMTTVVVLRYGFDIGLIAMQEAVIYLHACIFLLGAGYTLKHDEHVRVDVFYRKFNVKKQALVNLLGHLFLLMPVVIFICFMSWSYVAAAWRIMEKSVEAGGLPFVYLLKSLMIAFTVTLFLQGLSQTFKSLCVLVNDAKEQAVGGK